MNPQIKPCGTEPFDKTYGLGYKVGHDDFSPYGRVNRLRAAFLEKEFTVDVKRAEMITQVYRENPTLSPILKTARFLTRILTEIPLEIHADELIVGDIAAPEKAAPIYPEFSVSWIREELAGDGTFADREHDKFYITPEDKQTLLDLLPFWEGKTVADAVETEFDADQLKGGESGKKVYMTNLYHFAGVGHYVMDYERLMAIGLGGMLREAENGLKECENDAEKRAFYTAMAESLKASEIYIRRYANLAYQMAESETDDKRKTELIAIGDNCAHIASEPPQTMWQALQLWNFATTIALIESNGHSVSYGRMDQWLYPFYRRDMDNNTVTKAFEQELLECAFIKCGNPSKLRDRQSTKVRNGRGWGGESLTIGGVDKDGNDATNDLTFMMLEASVHTRMMDPWLCVRMSEKTPYELKVKTVECIRAGYGHPKLFNDRSAIEAMKNKGIPADEAWDYAVVGCVEPDLPGREYGYHDAAYMNIAKVMELALNGGKCVGCGKDCKIYDRCAGRGEQLAPDYGSLLTYRNMDEVLTGFNRQVAFWSEKMCNSIQSIEKAHAERKPLPFASAFFKHCVDTGREVSAGGAQYNFAGPQASGIATCADILSTIEQLVFNEKKYTGAELLDAVAHNWEGHEALYALVNSQKVHHFGNDDDFADKYFTKVFDIYCDNISGRKNARGGSFCPGVYTVNANVGLGMDLKASIDGRKDYEPISDNLGPVHTLVGSHDYMGPTAIANSVTKINHAKATNGTLLNWKFPPACVSGLEGRENLINFIDAYFEQKAMHCQFNIMSSAMMRDAMAHPEKHRDMLVRVAGYSAYFVELGEPLQMDLIRRTELSF
ncbi:MAG: formate C-acetyltransferase/glycerol dehydratase family glycyl radical enzyme [Ruminococcaceae bacterium]|nr:formate C-acetyltransferase/glycerol dehydratase family glycyl radical enzyme [Oscillospiraceae bacterium]